jgi:hypothetical protein
MDTALAPFKRIILRAILNDARPIVARVIAVPDDLEISDLHEAFLSIFGWTYAPGFIIRIHAQECNTFPEPVRPPTFFYALHYRRFGFRMHSGVQIDSHAVYQNVPKHYHLAKIVPSNE